MRRMRERVLALLLTLVMLVGMLPTAAFAAEGDSTGAVVDAVVFLPFLTN